MTLDLAQPSVELGGTKYSNNEEDQLNEFWFFSYLKARTMDELDHRLSAAKMAQLREPRAFDEHHYAAQSTCFPTR